MSGPSVAVFGMPEHGHFQRLRPLIADLVRRGFTTHVLTARRYEREVEQAGGRFVDLFAAYPLDAVDAESVPVPCRYVTYAGAYAEAIARDVAELRPALVVYDTFAVVGRVVARLLGLPYVNLCNGHNVDPAWVLPLLEADPRASISAGCRRAVETLRERYGVDDASPFSYVSGLSPFLNVYCEPPQYLTEPERKAFEPVAFYGSLPSQEELDVPRKDHGASPFGGGELRVYASFGTVVWRYWPAEALAALHAVSAALAARPGARGLISLGGTDPGEEVIRALSRPNVSVEGWVDQWRVLEDADVFITHQGLNSTHEAVFNGVPMLSYPFFGDQPGLAVRCSELGLAIPLVDAPRRPLGGEAIDAGLDKLAASQDTMRAGLAEALEWERAVIANRPAVLERIAALVA